VSELIGVSAHGSNLVSLAKPRSLNLLHFLNKEVAVISLVAGRAFTPVIHILAVVF